MLWDWVGNISGYLKIKLYNQATTNNFSLLLHIKKIFLHTLYKVLYKAERRDFMRKYLNWETAKGFLPYALAMVFILLVGNLFASDTSLYETLEKPMFSPPPKVFGIAWSILYTLMAISLYLIYTTDCTHKEECDKKGAYWIFFLQLIVNIIWPFIFFTKDYLFLAFLWILFLIVLVYVMLRKFAEINPWAAKLQLPYFLWLLFAAYLNYFIATMN